MRVFDWLFRDRRTGRIVVGQWPNAWLWGFGGARIAAAVTDGDISAWAMRAAHALLAVWAADELLRGVNPWRRVLGAGVLAWLAREALG